MGTKEIPLVNGGFTLVDADMFDYLNQTTWHLGSRGYVRTSSPLDGERMMHRAIMKPANGNLVIDHKNHNKVDNRKSNLRVCTHSQNMRNRKIPKNNSSGYKGVYKSVQNGKTRYRAEIQYDKKMYRLGRFKTAKEAAYVYDAAARYYHGRFAKTNFEKGETLSFDEIAERYRFYKAYKNLRPETDQDIYNGYMSGKTKTELSKQFGVSHSTIRRAIKRVQEKTA